MKTKFYFLPVFTFLFFNFILATSALLAMEANFINEGGQYGSVDSGKVHVVLITTTQMAAAPSILSKLLPEETQRLQEAKTAEEKYELGRAFAFDEPKFGRNLLQDERDQVAVSLFEASETPTALGRLGYLYWLDRAGLHLQERQRYARAKELLERDNSPWAINKIGDMYSHRTYRDYGRAAEHYRQTRDGYSWYRLGCLYSEGKIAPDACCGKLSNGRAAYKCFAKARELGYEVPREDEVKCGGFFNAGLGRPEGGSNQDICALGCLGGFLTLYCLYIPCCVGYGCGDSVPEDRL